jgi:hypothetical protein
VVFCENHSYREQHLQQKLGIKLEDLLTKRAEQYVSTPLAAI